MQDGVVASSLRLFNRVERAMNYLSASLTLVMMLFITLSVVTRNLANRPIPGVYETSELFMLGMIFLGMSFVQARRRHVTVTFVYQRFAPGLRLSVDVFILLLSALFWGAFTWQSALRAAYSWQIREYTLGVIEFPLYPAWTVLPLGAGLLTARLLIDLGLVVTRGSTAMAEDQSLHR
jgi:TRAP-type transport system small permease protein